MILHNPISFLLGEKETASALKTCQREREREREIKRLSSLKTCQRENHVSPHSPLKGRVLWGTLGVALMVLVALVVLVACPATSGASGANPRYLCENGTPVDGTTDTAEQTRCVSCDAGYTLENEACRLNRYVCLNGTPSSLRDATADGLTLCVSCDAGYASFNEVCLPSYVCVNGVAFDESADSVGQSRCVSCSPIATLNGTAGSIGTTCRANVMLGEAVRIGMANQFDEGESAPSGLAAIGETLYMVGLTNDVLYTLNIDSADGTADDGTATQVGSTTAGFGVSETAPYALEAMGNTLYMVGWSQAVLYTLNTTTGRATLVSDAGVTNFGVGESQPTGLAAIGGTLYMIGRAQTALYTINIDSTDTIPDGRAIQVGSASQFGMANQSDPRGLAAIGGTLYMGGLSDDFLSTLDPATGIGTRVGSATDFGVSEEGSTGLAAIGSTLYMVGITNDALYALRYQ